MLKVVARVRKNVHERPLSLTVALWVGTSPYPLSTLA